MMKHFINIILLCVGIALNADAQTFTQRIQKTAQGQGTVTIHHDAAIDALVNGPHSAVPATSITTPKAQEKTSVQYTRPQQDTVLPTVDTTTVQKKSTHSYKTTGYRIQVFAGGNSRKDKRTAEQTGSQLRTLFPNEAVYVHFYSPRWICRMGNYRSYEEAHQVLQEVTKLGYSSATIVKGKITVAY